MLSYNPEDLQFLSNDLSCYHTLLVTFASFRYSILPCALSLFNITTNIPLYCREVDCSTPVNVDDSIWKATGRCKNNLIVMGGFHVGCCIALNLAGTVSDLKVAKHGDM
jgi:hypothetical protein